MPTDIYARLRELAASADSKPAEMRPILLRVITDLFALHPEHHPQEIRLYEEMAQKLIDDADDAALAVVARKLARCPDAPSSLINRIRARGGAPAREILLSDSKVEWKDLRQIALSGAYDHACAVAARGDLDRELVKILAGRPEREVARALAGNRLAPLSAEERRLLAVRGREDAVLAQALLQREEISLDLLPLYLFADEQQRGKLIGLLRCADLAQAGRCDAAPRLDGGACKRLEAAALRQKRSSFALTLAGIVGCDTISARKIVEDESGDALTLAFLAIGLPREICARIFLIAFPKVALSPERFEANLRLYDTLPRREAARVVSAFTGSAPRTAATQTRTQALRAPSVGAFAPAQDKTPRQDDYDAAAWQNAS